MKMYEATLADELWFEWNFSDEDKERIKRIFALTLEDVEDCDGTCLTDDCPCYRRGFEDA